MTFKLNVSNKKITISCQKLKALGVIVLFILFQSIAPVSFAQVNTTIGNQKTIGGDYDDYAVTMKSIGNGYVALMQSGSTISSDRTIALKGWSDYWLVGLNPSLMPIWQKSYGGTGVDDAYGMLVTDSKDIIMVGISDSPISGNKTVANYGYGNVWVICTDSLGTIKWQKVYGGSPGEEDVKIVQLNNGNYVIGASSWSGISGTKTENNRGETDYWIFCIDSLGNQIWDKTLGGSKFDLLTDIVQVSNSELVIIGSSNSPISGDKTQDTVSFGDDTLNSRSGTDVWVVKYDFVNNKIIWDRTLGGDDEDGTYSAVVFDGTSIYIAASSLSGISGTKTTANFGGYDIWLNKLDTAGNIIWDKEYGGIRWDGPKCFKVLNSNSFIIGSTSSSPISSTKSENDIGPSSFYSDYWVFNIDTSGSIIWDKTIGGNSGDGLADILVKNKNHFLLMGSSISNGTGHKTEAVRGSSVIGQRKFDAWIVELMTNVSISENALLNFDVEIFPNPSSNYINISINDYSDKIQHIRVYSILGKEVLSKEVNVFKYQLDVRKLTSGIYIIEGQTSSGMYFHSKFMKE